MRPRVLHVCTVLLLLVARASVSGQALNGSADWGYGRSTFTTADQTTRNNSMTQAYTVDYQSFLWDPRFCTYVGGLTFYKNALTFGAQDGHSDQTGFNISTSLFPARPFPLSLRATRTIGGETANYPAGSPIRGGLTLEPGDVTTLQTRQSEFGLNWQLNTPRLPRVELSYQTGSAAVAAGEVGAVQHQSNLHALVARESPRLRNTLRYDRNGFDNALSQAFTQRYSDLSYEFFATAPDKTSASVRAGRRTTFSLFDVPPQFTSIGSGAYSPPPTGEVALYYGVATLTHRPVSRVMADVSVSYDNEKSGAGGTNALLGTATTRYNVFSGLTLRGSGTYGERGQIVNAARTTVATRAVGGGADYTVAFPFLQAAAAYDVGQGRSTGERGDGRTALWRASGDLSSGALRFVLVRVGYEQGRMRDDLLDFGNLWQERTRATARGMVGRLILEANWEQAMIDQGRDLTAARTRYVQSNGAAALDLSRNRRISVSAGRFVSRSIAGLDSTEFVGTSLESAIVPGLRLTITARREYTRSERSRLDQSGYYTTGVLLYRVRLFTFSVEHRYTDLALITDRPDPIAFVGNQILVRVGRRFASVR